MIDHLEAGAAAKKRNSEWRDGFLFIGNHLAVDFLNTLLVQNGQSIELLPDFPALLRWFRAAELLNTRDLTRLQKTWGESEVEVEALETFRAWRERLRKEILAWEDGGAVHSVTVRELNRAMAEHPMRTRLAVSGDSLSKELWFEAAQPSDLLAPLAHSAATLFAEVDRTRLRKCANCVLHFYDTSKKGTRRWCSMQLCGNRLKVSAYAARQRES